MLWQTYIRLFKDQLIALNRTPQDANPKRCGIGSSEMLGFEKRIDTRSTREPSITIGYELTQTYSAFCMYREKNSTVQLMEVDATEVIPQP